MEFKGDAPGCEAPSLLWLLLLVPLFAIGVQHGFWAPDEPREAEISREIYASGDWVVPRLNGKPFLEKPPLTHWGGALVFKVLGGPSERWCRLPSAAWGLAGALAVAWLATMLAGRTAGILAAFVLATNTEWALNSRMLHVDMPLAGAVALSLALFWYGYSSPAAARKRLGYLGCALAAGAAFLSKGTIGLVLTGSVFLVFLLLRRDWREIARLLSPLNIAACMACVFPWLVMLYLREGTGALRVFIWDNQVLRFFSSAADHAKPAWFYLEKFSEAFVPWIIFLPPALLRLVRPRGQEGPERRSRLFILVAAVVPFVILSAASGKRIRYLLPLIPVFSVAVAAWLAAAWEGSRTRWEGYWRSAGFGCAALVAAGSWCVSLYFAIGSGSYLPWAATGMLFAAGFTALSVGYAVRLRGAHLAGITVAFVAVALVAIVTPPLRTQIIDSRRSYGGALAGLVNKLDPGDALYGYEVSGAEGGVIAFNLGSTFPEIETLEGLEEILRADPRNAVYMTGEIYDNLAVDGLLPAGADVVLRHRHNRGEALLMRGGGRTE